MKNKILQLSKNCNSLEIARILSLSLNEVEKVLIDEYFQKKWKISKKDLEELAARIYNESPTLLSDEFNISEVTLKKYLADCKLFNTKKNVIYVQNSEEEIEKLLEDEELRKRIARFVTMSGEEFFDEVYTHLSPEELEEYLEENPSERKYLKRYEP